MKLLDDLFERFSSALKGGIKMESLDHLFQQYNGVDWKPYKYFTPVHFSKHIIRLNDILELEMICWEPGQRWDLHDHPRDGEMMKVLQGGITICRYELLMKPVYIDRHLLHTDAVYYCEGSIFGHSLCNESDKRTVTLHLYSPPHFRPTFY